MNKKVLIIIVVLIAVVVILSGVLYFHIPQKLEKYIGTADIVSASASPFGASPAISSFSFKEIANNSDAFGNGISTANEGWAGWHINSTVITIYSNNYSTNHSAIPPIDNHTFELINPMNFTSLDFAKIVNTVDTNVTLNLSENLTGGRIMSYAIQPSGTYPSGYVVAITNGTNYTLKNVSTISSKNIAVGVGTVLSGSHNVILPAGDTFYITLGILPVGYNNNSHQIIYGFASDGAVSISLLQGVN
ncbi:MAG: hypothetical protein QXL94_00040 [Candidatus Parvarchaeum sp.]